MKHTLRTILALCLTVITAFCMSGSVFAATVTVKDSNGNTYTAAKVLEATETGTNAYTYKATNDFDGFFGNEDYGNYTLSDRGEIKDATGKVISGGSLAYDKENYDRSSDQATLASYLQAYAQAKKITGTEIKSGTTDLGNGFYLVRETASGDKNSKEVASKPALVSVTSKTEAVTITPKNDEVDLEKKIVENSKLVDANDVNVGDTVNYQISTHFPTYDIMASEKLDKDSVVFILTDNFSKGLTYDEKSLAIKGFKAGEDYTATYADGKLTIEFKDETIRNHQGQAVVATYTAVLNKDAVVNSTDGNPNDVTLEYTNNPNELNKHKTLTDEVKTFTYGFEIKKVDIDNITEDLAGAEFVVYDKDGKTPIAHIKYDKDGKPEVVDSTKETTVKGDTIKFNGLDEGEYIIQETNAPEGYSLLGEGIKVTITADKEDGNLTGTATITADGNGVIDKSKDQGINDNNVKIENKDGAIHAIVTIGDKKGVSLPETGSKNAMRLMIGGGAVILLGLLYYGISRRREREAE
ncbi:MAG: SpaH/EbpB family LPXTG-anchored major pilin [Firmicutes bacterium]|nr:SpaH/EbpB family LPXTG-anchored major pilin [Bacillota bacterium]